MGRGKKAFRELRQLPVNAIAVEGRALSSEPLAALAQSLDRTGCADPIVVTEEQGGYRVLLGAPRLLAAQRLGWQTIAALVCPSSLGNTIAVLDPPEGADVSPWEQADALQALKTELDCTQAQLGQLIGRRRDYVAGMLAIVQIAPETRAFVLAQPAGRQLRTRHLRYVARTYQDAQLRVAKRILEQELSTTALERAQQKDRLRSVKEKKLPLRKLLSPGDSPHPETPKAWRKYQQRLSTDLRRINRYEARQKERLQSTLRKAREGLKQLAQETRQHRRALQRELQRARTHL